MENRMWKILNLGPPNSVPTSYFPKQVLSKLSVAQWAQTWAYLLLLWQSCQQPTWGHNSCRKTEESPRHLSGTWVFTVFITSHTFRLQNHPTDLLVGIPLSQGSWDHSWSRKQHSAPCSRWKHSPGGHHGHPPVSPAPGLNSESGTLLVLPVRQRLSSGPNSTSGSLSAFFSTRPWFGGFHVVLPCPILARIPRFWVGEGY